MADDRVRRENVDYSGADPGRRGESEDVNRGVGEDEVRGVADEGDEFEDSEDLEDEEEDEEY